MVKIKKDLTHIYHMFAYSLTIPIGSSASVSRKSLALFDKSLALTSDLERLPFLLGGKVYLVPNAHALYGVFESAISGASYDVFLMNGTYSLDDFDNPFALISDPRAVDDILLHANGLITWNVRATDGVSTGIELSPSHWDFEGQIVLYDTITLIIFTDVDTNVAVVEFAGEEMIAMAEIEIDWRPFSKSELQEFIMEHIYAKQGD